jgi:hypothetical protein
MEEVYDLKATDAFLQHAQGGLPQGKLSLVFARSGVGKSTFAVNFAINAALQAKHVLHFSVGMTSERVHEYYHEVFLDWARHNQTPKHQWADCKRHFTAITYPEAGDLLNNLEREVTTLCDAGQLNTGMIIIDGWDFVPEEHDQFARLAELAKKQYVPLLMTLRIHRHDNGQLDIESPFQAAYHHTDSIYLLDYRGTNTIEIQSLRHGIEEAIPLPFYLDPHSMVLMHQH